MLSVHAQWMFSCSLPRGVKCLLRGTEQFVGVAGTTLWPGSHVRLQRTLPNEQACGFVENEAYILERDAIIEQVRRLTVVPSETDHSSYQFICTLCTPDLQAQQDCTPLSG